MGNNDSSILFDVGLLDTEDLETDRSEFTLHANDADRWNAGNLTVLRQAQVAFKAAMFDSDARADVFFDLVATPKL